MLTSRSVVIDGKSFGAVYTFEKAGDIFPVHTHTEETNHITVLLFGSIRASGHEKYEGKIYEAKSGGTIINWTAGEPHGFEALVDGTTIMNIPRK